jgi:predicted PurR-regulated permease PerM
VYFVVFSVLGFFVFVIGDLVVTQLQKLAGRVDEFSFWATETFRSLTKDTNFENKQFIEEQLVNSLSTFGEYFNTFVQGLTTQAFTVVRMSITVIFYIFIIPIWVFYVLYRPRKIANLFISAIPKSLREDVHALVTIVNAIGQRYLMGQLMLCSIVGSLTYVGLLILQIPYPIPLAIFIGIFEAVPNIGPWIGAIPALIVAAPLGLGTVLSVLILYVIVQQLENTLLVPRVQAQVMEFPEAVVYVLLIIGGTLWGLAGMIIILPLSAAFRDMFHYVLLRLSDRHLSSAGALEKVRKEPFGVDNL